MTTTKAADYYALLGVEPSATTAQIKSAYRKLASNTTRTSTTTLTPPNGSGRSPKPTTPSPTRTGDAATTGSTPPRAAAPPAETTSGPGTPAPATARPGTGVRRHSAQAAGRAEGPGRHVARDPRSHPEIPPVTIIIASGTDGEHPRWGHHAPDRWNVASEQLTEIMISGEGLRRSRPRGLRHPAHEAAHALAHARGIKDTSRQGRYHNKRFKTYAEEARPGRRARRPNGWSVITLAGSARRVTRQIPHSTSPRLTWRHAETTTGPTTRRTTNLIAAGCPCSRSIRVAASTLAEAPIICQACDGKFQAQEPR